MTDGIRKARDGRHLLGFTSHILVDLSTGYIPNISHLYRSPSLSSTAYLETKRTSPLPFTKPSIHCLPRDQEWQPPDNEIEVVLPWKVDGHAVLNRSLPGNSGIRHQSRPISSLSTGPDTAPIPVACHALCVHFPCRRFRQLPVETPVLGKGRNRRRERMMRTPRPGLPKLASDQSLDRLPEPRLPEQPRWRAKWQPHQIATVLTSSKTFAWQACNHPPTSLLYTSVDRQARNHPQTKDQRPFLLLQHKSPAGRRSATTTQVLMA